MNKETILKVSNLTIYYYTIEGIIKAVRNISFEINKGESLCLVGESGSGKSTVGLAIAMALPSNARIVRGEIVYSDINLLTLDEKEREKYRGKEISIIFQDPVASINPLFTIGEQLYDVISNNLGINDNNSIRKISINALKKAGLSDYERILKSYPHELSGGMLQRASIAIALSSNPKLLIADEPTTMLDVTLQAEILDLLNTLKSEYNLSILFITHNLGVAAEICNRIIIMYAGNILEEGSTDEILLNPLHPYTEKLIKCVPRSQIKVEKLRHIPGVLPDPKNPPKGCPFQSRCEYSREICAKQIPRFIKIKGNHSVACFKYYKEWGF